MNLTSWRVRCVAIGLLISAPVVGQEAIAPPPPVPAPPPPERVQTDQDRATESDKPADPFAKLEDQPSEPDVAPKKQEPRFPVGGFTGKGLRLPAANRQAQQQANDRAARGGANNNFNNNFNRAQQFPVVNQPPVYLPNYNQNRPYGYPGYGYPSYGYPGYIYNGYGYGYGYGHGVWSPGFGGTVPGGSNYFGNPHASQYMGNPHASQGR